MNKLIFFLSLMLSVGVFFSGPVSAQNYVTKKTAGKKLVKIFDKAMELNRAENFPAALQQLDKALALEPDFIDGYVIKGAILYDQRQLEAAKANFEKVIELDAAYYPRVFYQLGLTERKMEQFDAAAKNFEQFLQYEKKRERLIARAKKHLVNSRFAAEAIQSPVPFQPVRLNDNINTSKNEFLPYLTADQEVLIYS